MQFMMVTKQSFRHFKIKFAKVILCLDSLCGIQFSTLCRLLEDAAGVILLVAMECSRMTIVAQRKSCASVCGALFLFLVLSETKAPQTITYCFNNEFYCYNCSLIAAHFPQQRLQSTAEVSEAAVVMLKC